MSPVCLLSVELLILVFESMAPPLFIKPYGPRLGLPRVGFKWKDPESRGVQRTVGLHE